MTLVHKVTGENALFIKRNKTQLVLRLQELGLSLENANLIVEYGVLSYEGITAIMLGNSILSPEDKRIKIAYDALYRAQNMAQYDSKIQSIEKYLSQFSEDELFAISQKKDVIAQAQEYNGSRVYKCIVSSKDAQSMAMYKKLRSRKGQMELEQRFGVQHKTQTVEIEDVQLEVKAPSSISRQGKTARTGSTKNKQTTTDIDVIAHAISKALPPSKKIKKYKFEEELKKRCDDEGVPFNTTDVRAAWKKFPQEQKYGVGEK